MLTIGGCRRRQSPAPPRNEAQNGFQVAVGVNFR
jgi:hypothetical protein